MKRALGLAFAGVFLLVQPVAASDYSATGKARATDRLVVVFSTSAAGDVAATATWNGNTKWGKVWVHNVADDAIQCQSLTFTSPASCTIVGAPAGQYRAEWWPNTQSTATLTVHTPD